MKKFKTILSTFFIFTSFFLLQGCEDSQQIQVNNAAKNVNILQNTAETRYKELTKHVTDDSMRGKYETALTVALYEVKKQFPDNPAIEDLEKQFKKDMTDKGTIFNKITKDYNEVMSRPEKQYASYGDKDVPKSALNSIINYQTELTVLKDIVSVERFDEHFIDYINTLAALSDKVSPVIVDKVNKDEPLGSTFVGNPSYGEWKTNPSTGHVAWEFFQTYMFLSFLDDARYNGNYYGYNSYRTQPYYSPTRGSAYRYDSWRNNRNYSYYNDVYSQKYAKPTERKQYNKFNTSLSNKYSSSIKDTNVVTTQNKTVQSKYSKFSSNLVSSSGKASKNFDNLSNVSKNNTPKNVSIKQTSKKVSVKSGK